MAWWCARTSPHSISRVTGKRRSAQRDDARAALEDSPALARAAELAQRTESVEEKLAALRKHDEARAAEAREAAVGAREAARRLEALERARDEAGSRVAKHEERIARLDDGATKIACVTAVVVVVVVSDV